MFRRFAILFICFLALPTLVAEAFQKQDPEEVLQEIAVLNTDPFINFGPLSFGLSELPEEISGTFIVDVGFPTGGGAFGYGLKEVISANLIFGDIIAPNNLMAFDLELDPDWAVEAFSYTLATFNTPTVADGVIEMNGITGMNFVITGTDIASGLPFSYTYANSTAAATAIYLGDVNLDGAVNLLDVAPFVDRLATGTFQIEADVNFDGFVNLLDVEPFVVLLSGA